MHLDRSKKPGSSQKDIPKISMQPTTCWNSYSRLQKCYTVVTMFIISISHHQQCPQEGSAVKDTISKPHHPKVPVPTDVSNR